MRILIISTFFPPLNSIGSLRPYSWAKFWTQEGHDVTVLTTKKQEDPSHDLRLPDHGFTLIEVPLPSYVYSLKKNYRSPSTTENQEKKSSLLGNLFHSLRRRKGIFHACRMPDFTDLWIRPAWHAIKDKGTWDVVVSSSGPYAVNFVAKKLKKSGHTRRWIADFRDRWSDNHIFPGLFPFTIFEKAWERRLMKYADAITTVSLPYASTFSKKYGETKVHVVENGFDVEDLKAIPRIPIFFDDGKYRIVHTGSLFRRGQDPIPLFDSIVKMSKDPNKKHFLDKLEVLFVGPELSSLESLISEYQIGKWVKTFGFVNREVALRMQRDAHALLFFPWNDSSVEGVYSGKIFEYLFSGTPILAVGGKKMGAPQQLILDANAGKLLPTADTVEEFFTEKLQNISKERTQIDSKFLEQYSRKTLAKKFLEIAEKIKNG